MAFVRDADVVPEVLSSEEGVQVESASRMEYDRSRWMRLPAEGTADPEKADAEFMRCILQLLRKVCCSPTRQATSCAALMHEHVLCFFKIHLRLNRQRLIL